MLAVIDKGDVSVKDHERVIFSVSFFLVNFLHQRHKFPSTCHLEAVDAPLSPSAFVLIDEAFPKALISTA